MKKTIAFFITIAMLSGATSVQATATNADKLATIKADLSELAQTKNTLSAEKKQLTNKREETKQTLKEQSDKLTELTLEQQEASVNFSSLESQRVARKEQIKAEQAGHQVSAALKNMGSLLKDSNYRHKLLTNGVSLEEYLLETDEQYSSLLEKKEQVVEKQISLTYQIKEQKEYVTVAKDKDLQANQVLKKKLADVVKEIKAEQKEQQMIQQKIKAAEEKRQLFQAPLSKLNVTSGFGTRSDPTGFSGTSHKGIDFSGSLNQAVFASKQGKVVKTGFDARAGNYVIIKHSDGWYTYYMHLNHITATEGSSVKTGQKIGGMGTTGNSTGVHLHFGIASTANFSGFVNPAPYLRLK